MKDESLTQEHAVWYLDQRLFPCNHSTPRRQFAGCPHVAYHDRGVVVSQDCTAHTTQLLAHKIGIVVQLLDLAHPSVRAVFALQHLHGTDDLLHSWDRHAGGVALPRSNAPQTLYQGPALHMTIQVHWYVTDWNPAAACCGQYPGAMHQRHRSNALLCNQLMDKLFMTRQSRAVVLWHPVPADWWHSPALH